jgi:hypothetical protein
MTYTVAYNTKKLGTVKKTILATFGSFVAAWAFYRTAQEKRPGIYITY